MTTTEVLRRLAPLSVALEQAEAGAEPRANMAAAAHALDGLYALAWGNETQQRALSPAACSSVAALLRAPAVLGDASLAEKTLRAVRVLCRYGQEKSTRNEAAEAALVSAGACEGNRGIHETMVA